MENPFSLKSKTIVITGASSGIGRQCAIDCASMGANIILIARNEERLKETLNMMEGDGHHYYVADIAIKNTIATLVSSIVEDNGKIDGFVHSAGIEKTLPIKLLAPSDYEEVFKINTLSAFEFVRQFNHVKIFNKGGSIVFISSISGFIARPGLAAYSASKGALISTSKVMALEMSKKAIRVNCISPGTILTPMMEKVLQSMTEDAHEKRVSGFPLGLGQPSDISYACIYLLSDASRWVTGQNLIVDGGYTVL